MGRALVALVVALALPAAAVAKGPVTAAVCGPDRCAAFDVRGYHDQVLAAEPKWDAAPPPRSYYRIELRDEGGLWSSPPAYYEPASGLFASTDGFGLISWSPLGPAAVADAARSLPPYPPPRVTTAFVGDRRVSGDPSTYLALLSLDGEFRVPGERARFEQIRLESPVPNPWTETMLLYYPDERILFTTAGLYVTVPPDVAADLDAARALGGEAPRVIPWLPFAVGLAGAVALVALRLRGGARRPFPAKPSPTPS